MAKTVLNKASINDLAQKTTNRATYIIAEYGKDLDNKDVSKEMNLEVAEAAQVLMCHNTANLLGAHSTLTKTQFGKVLDDAADSAQRVTMSGLIGAELQKAQSAIQKQKTMFLEVYEQVAHEQVNLSLPRFHQRSLN